VAQVKPSPDSAEGSRGDVGVLRAAGLRVTGPRLAVLRALRRRPHAEAETVRSMVAEELGAVSPQATYNVLAALVDAGIARRIEPAGSVALYELRVGDNHHHVVCRGCGITADVDCAVGRRPCLTPSDTHGFVLDEAEVTFWGLCPACQSHQEATSHTPTRSAGRVGRDSTPKTILLPASRTRTENRPTR
jgi:Fe2+ or Zn2+ uptake regulation protein